MQRHDALVLNSGEPLSKAVHQILDSGLAVVVVKDGNYFGIIDDRNISFGINDASKIKCETATTKAPCLLDTSSTQDKLNAFLSGHFKSLPLKEAGTKVFKIITRVDLLKELLENKMFPQTFVSQIANKPVFTVDENETVGNARAILKENNTHKLIVTKNGKPIGVVSTFDLLSTIASPKGRKDDIMSEADKSSNMAKVSGFLKDWTFAVEENTLVEDAIKKMIEKNVAAILVTSNGKPSGVFSAFDLFNLIVGSNKPAGTQIMISGLSEDAGMDYQEAKETIEKVLDKFSKSLEIRNVSIHFKHSKSMFEAHLSAQVKGEHVNCSTQKHDFKTALDAIATELYTLLSKKKSILTYKKGKGHEKEE